MKPGDPDFLRRRLLLLAILRRQKALRRRLSIAARRVRG